MRVQLLMLIGGLVIASSMSLAIAKTIRTERIEVPTAEGSDPVRPAVPAVPKSAIENPTAPTEKATQPAPTGDPGDAGENKSPSADGKSKIPVIHYGDAGLPDLVQRMRDSIIEAAKSGVIENLRPVLESNEMPPTLSFGGVEDPIEHLKTVSGDAEGREVMAILMEVLEAGWVHMDKGTPQEMYVWPYFAHYPLHELSPSQFVELFKIVTAGDYQDMESFGAYIFYRVGIGPDGTWHFFVAGD